MNSHRLAGLLMVAVLAVTPGLAASCSCTPLSDLENYCAASQVLVADIVAADRRLTLDTGIKQTDFKAHTVWQIHFRTAESLKGEPLLYGLAITPGFEGECGVEMRPGTRALIFLDARGAVHACSGSIADLKPNRESDALLATLRQLSKLPKDALAKRCPHSISR